MARVLITGCSTGFGRATAIELTKRGHEVVATARRPETIDDLDVTAKLTLDVDDATSVATAVDAAGPLDVLVNNAGFGVHAPVEYLPIDDLRAMFDTNFFGALRMIQAVLPGMRERGGGVIVNVSSVAGRVGGPFGGGYGASKWALEGLSESLHYEVGHFGIRVAVIEPGVFDTGFQTNNRAVDEDRPPYDELQRQWDGAVARLGDGSDPPGPEPVAAAIADAIEDPQTSLRVAVGADAELVTATRAAMSDADFEVAMRQALQIHW